jgi:hypothetical protein
MDAAITTSAGTTVYFSEPTDWAALEFASGEPIVAKPEL